jgi:hypothetical protein
MAVSLSALRDDRCFNPLNHHVYAFKDGPSNYRQISLLTSFSKIFEKVILSGLNQYISDNNIIVWL